MSGLAANLLSLATGQGRLPCQIFPSWPFGEFREYLIDAVAHGLLFRPFLPACGRAPRAVVGYPGG